MMKDPHKIIQIMPADGWKEVRWKNVGDDESTIIIYTVPLVGWALVERPEEEKRYAGFVRDGEHYLRRIEPIYMGDDLYLANLDENRSTLGICLHVDTDMEYWQETARDAWRNSRPT